MTNKNKHLGSSFDDFLKEEEILSSSEIEAVKCIIAYLLTLLLEKNHLEKQQAAVS